ncbi:hypothetical protein BDZ89DRAFT_1106968 [Hymenopellis radicata]|nr:hypothetical protein BDZ89DRAFT_1106968 [Hymenopellis radicata]
MATLASSRHPAAIIKCNLVIGEFVHEYKWCYNGACAGTTAMSSPKLIAPGIQAASKSDQLLEEARIQYSLSRDVVTVRKHSEISQRPQRAVKWQIRGTILDREVKSHREVKPSEKAVQSHLDKNASFRTVIPGIASFSCYILTVSGESWAWANHSGSARRLLFVLAFGDTQT